METNSNVKEHFVAADFSRSTRAALKKRGIVIIGGTYIPGQGNLPYANGQRGYELADKGTLKVRTFAQVLEMAGA